MMNGEGTSNSRNNINLTFFPLAPVPVAAFDVEKFSQEFNIDIINSGSKDNWDSHYQDILRLRAEAQSKTDPSQMMKNDKLAYLCAHAAWAIHFKFRKAGYDEARDYIDFARQLAQDDKPMVQGYLNYVISAILRGNDKFQQALNLAKEAIEHFKAVPEIDPAVMAHAYNQAGLAALRLNDVKEDPLVYFSHAEEQLERPREALSTEFDARRLLAAAEGDPAARTHMNIAQRYLALKSFAEAYHYFNLCTEPRMPLEKAYRNVIKGECLIGMRDYEDAMQLLLGSCEIYEAESKVNDQNYLRAVLGLTRVYFSLVADGHNEHVNDAQEYLDIANRVHTELRLDPEHDFSKQLDQLRVDFEQHKTVPSP